MQWHHNELNGVSNHPASRLFAQPFVQAQIKEKSKLRVTGLCEGNSPVTGEFPTQRASNKENVSFDDVIMVFQVSQSVASGSRAE